MNHWQYEQYKQIDEFYRQQMRFEVQTERLVQQYRVYHPGRFEQTMFRLANWLIGMGKQLRKRYEIPASTGSRQESHPI